MLQIALYRLSRKVLSVGVLGFLTFLLPGASPLLALAPLTQAGGVAGYLTPEWQIASAERALSSGLVGLAEAQYREALETAGGLSPDLRESASLGLAASLIAQSAFDRALDVLGAIEPSAAPARHQLYRTLAAYGQEAGLDSGALGDFLESIDPGRLDARDRPWYYFLKGVQEASGDPGAEAGGFAAARAMAASPEQAAFFKSLMLRQRILSTDSGDEKLLAEVREKLEELSGRAAAYPYILEYALLLARMDRAEAAVEALDAEVSATGSAYSGEERAQLLLLKGIILGEASEAGRTTLKEIVRSGQGRAPMAIALQLLVRSMESPAEMLGFLSQVIAQSQSHPLVAQLYYLRAQLALSSAETASIAEADARYLLEQYPGARELEDVYGLLAYAAVQREPPEYRAAAEYLSQVREAVVSAEENFRINRLIGDCYFLNGDFANAVDFYRSADRERGAGGGRSAIFLRLAVAEMRAGQLEEAIRYVDEADFGGKIDQSDRWMAEWNISRALLREGAVDRALGRVEELLRAAGNESVPTALDLRLRWLALHLRYEVGDLEGLSESVERLLQRVEAMPGNGGGAGGKELSLLRAELMLLRANTMLAEGDTEAGFSVLEALRAAYPRSAAAERTFLAEVSYHASRGDFRAAQSVLVDLAETYPEGRLAAQALFEAALYCEQRGPAQFGEAILLLDRLVDSYPESPMVYHARLKQGNLLRLLNDFASAQLVFENLINTYPEHPRRHVAELAYADCLFALAVDDASELSEAAAILERLLDLPDLSPAQELEVSYKMGLVLERRGARADARDVFTAIATDYLLVPERVGELGRLGQYWLSRGVFELGAMLESEGAHREARRLYRKMIAFNLPGRSIANERLGQMPETVEENQE